MIYVTGLKSCLIHVLTNIIESRLNTLNYYGKIVQEMSFSTGSKFIVGINKGWFGGKFDNDLGFNQFSIGRLYRSTVPNPALPDPNPSIPYISTHPEELTDFFQQVSNIQQENNSNSLLYGTQIVRVWTFERFEGLKFDNNGNVNGIDNELLINLGKVFNVAKAHQISIYLCLFDTWSIYQNAPMQLVTAGKEQDYIHLQQTWKSLMKKLLEDAVAREMFFNNALLPLLNNISAHTNLFAIDVINEPEGLTTKDPTIKFSDIKNYIKSCANYIHSHSSSKVSCGFQRYTTVKNNANDLAQNLDFFDFHEYNKEGNLGTYRSSEFAGKPCIVGECGYPVGNIDDLSKALLATVNFFKNSNSKGYAGCVAWVEDYENKNDIIQAIKDFANTNPLIMQETKSGCFIATAAMGSELHPHVQFLRDYRDSVIMKSSYRKQFLQILVLYYSFSPPIAEAMEKNRLAKFTFKYIIVYPIIVGLKILAKIVGK